MDYGVNMDNVSKNFLRRATAQHHRICSKLNQTIGKALFIEWPHGENELCPFTNSMRQTSNTIIIHFCIVLMRLLYY